MTSPQIIQQADDLKASVADTSSGSNEAWVSRQALQDLYQKLLVMDLEFALDKKVEQDLWNHAFKNQITVLQNQAKDKQNPKRSEIQSSLNLFLETAGGFYLQLLQELCSAFKLDLPFRRKSSNFGVLKEYDSVSSKIQVPKPSSSMYICQHCLVHLGDIARYRQQIDQAQSYYRHAAHLVPYNGQPYNQLAILEAAKSNKLATVFYYARSIAVKHPFPVASTNLDKFYTKISKETYDYRGKLSMSETISTFLQFHAFIHLDSDSDKARKHGERLIVSLPTHLTSTSFSSYQLVQMVAINLFALHHAKRMHANDEHTDNKDAPTNGEGSRAFGIVFDLTMSMMEQLVYNTPKQEQKAKDYHTMPALKVILDWLLSDHSHLPQATCVNSGIWGNLSKLLNNLQFHGGQKDVVFDPDKYTRTPLPEDCDLQCFLPLMKAGADLNFTKATTDIISGEMEIRLRCHRLVEHGQYIADNFSPLSLLTYTRLKSGRLQFSCPLGQVKILTGPDIERKHVRQNVAIQAIMQKKDTVPPTSKDASTEQSMRPMDAPHGRRTSMEDHRGDSNLLNAHSEGGRKVSPHVAQPLPQPVPQQQPQPQQPSQQHAYQQQQQFQQYGQYAPGPYPQYQPHQPLPYQQQQHQQQQHQQQQHQQQQHQQQQHQQQHNMGIGMNGGDTQQHQSQQQGGQVSARETHSPGSHAQMGVHLQPQMGGGHLGGYSHGAINSQGSPQGLSPAMRSMPHQQSMPQGMHGYNISNSGSPRGSLDLTGQQQGGQKAFQPAPGSGMSSVSQSGLAPGAQFSSQVAPPQPVGHHQGMMTQGPHGGHGVAPSGGRSGMHQFPQSQSFPQNFPQSYPQQSYNANQQFVDGSSRVGNMFPSSSPTNNNLHSSPSFGSSFPQARAPSPQNPQSLSTTPNTILNLLNSGSLSSGFGISPAMMALASTGAPSMPSNRNPQIDRYMRHREDADQGLGYTAGQGLGQVIGQGMGQGIGNFSVDTESNPAMMLQREDFNKDEPELKFSDLSLDSDSRFSPSSGLGLSGLTIGDQTRNPKTGSPINIPSGISSLFSLPTDAGIGAQTNSTYSLFSKSPWTVQLSNKPDSNKSLSSSPFGSGEDSGSVRNTPDPFGDMADMQTLSSSFPLSYAPFGSPDSNWTNEPNPNHAAAEKANTLLSNSIQSLWSSGPSPLEKLLEQQKQQQRHCDPH